MQLILAGLIAYGLIASRPKTIVNGGIALLMTFSPAIFERNYRFPLDPWLGLWITTAVLLHALGSTGLYVHIEWWDHLTHAMSASLVAAVGYTAARAIELHVEEIIIPRQFMFVYVLVVVLAFGVIWELFEFGLDIVADTTGLTMPLAQHGLGDTIADLTFNSIGALVVAVFGHVHLSNAAESIMSHILTSD